MTQALLTLAAVVVGGALAIAGSLVVGRHELRRHRRIVIFDELIPDTAQWVADVQCDIPIHGPYDRFGDSHAYKIYRTAVVAGPRDEEFAKVVRDQWIKVEELGQQIHETESADLNPPIPEQQIAALDVINQQLSEYSEWLSKRLGRRWW